MKKRHKTDYYWQKHINGVKHYVRGLDWLLTRIKNIRLLEVYPVRPKGKTTRMIVYLEGNIIYHAKFKTYEEAKEFVIQTNFNTSNKEIHSN